MSAKSLARLATEVIEASNAWEDADDIGNLDADSVAAAHLCDKARELALRFVDVSSSASRQHYIDTGEYLPREAAES